MKNNFFKNLMSLIFVLSGCEPEDQQDLLPPRIPAAFASNSPSDANSEKFQCRIEFLPVRNGSCTFDPMTPQALMRMFPGQDFLPQIWLRNTTKDTLKVPFELDVRFEVVGPDGQLMNGLEIRKNPIAQGERPIAPGQEVRFGYDCESRHGFLVDHAAKFDLRNSGQYFIRAVATSNAETGALNDLWTGTVRSAPAAIGIRSIEYGPEKEGLQISLVSYVPTDGGLPLGVVFRNLRSKPTIISWDANQLLHLTITDAEGKPVRDDFATVCGPLPSVTLQPNDLYCYAHELDWSVILNNKPGQLSVSASLNVMVNEVGEASKVSLKSNTLILSPGKQTNQRPQPFK